jgi:ribosomal protein S18 acetylase RimI-like enzyme
MGLNPIEITSHPSSDTETLELVAGTAQTAESAAQVLAQAFASDPGMSHIVEPIEAASHVLAQAFAGDSGMSHLVAPIDTAARRQGVMGLCRYFIQYTMKFGVVSLVTHASQVVGASCLIPPSAAHVGLVGELAAGGWKLPYRLGIASCWRAISVSDALATRHDRAMRDQPHWYLFQMAVAPAEQRRGIGRMLLRDLLGRADADGVACYLETFSPRNVEYYRAHDFEVLSRFDIRAGKGNALPCWQLSRPVRG